MSHRVYILSSLNVEVYKPAISLPPTGLVANEKNSILTFITTFSLETKTWRFLASVQVTYFFFSVNYNLSRLKSYLSWNRNASGGISRRCSPAFTFLVLLTCSLKQAVTAPARANWSTCQCCFSQYANQSQGPGATAARFCFRRIGAGVVFVTVNGAICSRRLILARERDYVQMI